MHTKVLAWKCGNGMWYKRNRSWLDINIANIVIYLLIPKIHSVFQVLIGVMILYVMLWQLKASIVAENCILEYNFSKYSCV